MSLFIFIVWILLNALLVNLGVKAGWDYDPGFIGPVLIVLSFHLIIGLFLSNRDS